MNLANVYLCNEQVVLMGWGDPVKDTSLMFKREDEKSDSWALGVILFFLMTYYLPFVDTNVMHSVEPPIHLL